MASGTVARAARREAALAHRAAAALLVLVLVACCAPAPAAAGSAWWVPSANGSEGGWQYQLSTAFSMATDPIANVNVYVVDHEDTSKAVVTKMLNASFKPVCYFSAGTIETYRSDYRDFLALNATRRVIGRVLPDWPDEAWLNTSDSGVRALMLKRIRACKSRGFVAVDPDNVDGWANANGLGLTKQGAISYIRWLSNQAHALNMSCGVKNALDVLPSVVGYVDFAVNEQCSQYSECDAYAPFKAANKFVLQVEYREEIGLATFQGAGVCGKAAQFGTTPIFKKYSLGKWRYACTGKP